MKAVNIYSVTRVPDWRLMNEMEQQLSNRLEPLQMREHEWTRHHHLGRCGAVGIDTADID